MAKRKPMTAGERIICLHYGHSLQDIRDGSYTRSLVNMIDRAINRAVKAERAKWQTAQTFAPRSRVVKLKRGKQ